MRALMFALALILFVAGARVLFNWEVYGEAPDTRVMVQGVGAAFFALAALAIRAARRS